MPALGLVQRPPACCPCMGGVGSSARQGALEFTSGSAFVLNKMLLGCASAIWLHFHACPWGDGQRLRFSINYFPICQASFCFSLFLYATRGEGRRDSNRRPFNINCYWCNLWQHFFLLSFTFHCFPDINGPHPPVIGYPCWIQSNKIL